MEEDLKKAKKSALRLLAFRPRSERELATRLKDKKFEADTIDRVLSQLRSEGQLDDARYAKLFALSRMQSRAMGKNLIRRELAGRGLSVSHVAAAMQNLADFSEEKIALEFAKRRHELMRGLSREVQRRRLHGVLARRGFESSVIMKVLASLVKNIPIEDEA